MKSMNVQRKWCAALAAMIVAAVGVVHQPVQAQFAVVDVPHTLQTILAEAKRHSDTALDYANQARQLQQQINMYSDAVRNSDNLKSFVWQRAQRDIRDLAGLYNNTRALAHTAANLDSQFGKHYGSYDRYLSDTGGASMRGSYQRWADESYDNAKMAMLVGGMQSSMLNDEDELMNTLINQSNTATGRMQALQIANQIAGQQVQQTQKLRQLLIAQVNMQSNAMALANDRQSRTDAATQKFHEAELIRTKGKEY